MFYLYDLEPLEPWQQAHERDGSFVSPSSVREHFVIRRATKEDRLLGYLSALTASGKLLWAELGRKHPIYSGIQIYSYHAVLPGTSMWEVDLRHPDDVEFCHLRISRGKNDAVLINQPGEVITNLYNRIYESHGHQLAHVPAFRDQECSDKDQALLDAGLGVLEQALKKT